MKNVVLCMIVLLASQISASATNELFATRRSTTPVHPSKMAEYNAKTGGLVNPPVNSRKVLFLDARKKSEISFENKALSAARFLDFSYEIRKSDLPTALSPYRFAKSLRVGDVGAVVLYFESDEWPVMSVFPEEAITMVNVKPLHDDNADVFNQRVAKEFWRALSFTLGGYEGSQQSATVMAPIFSVQELDTLRSFSLSPYQIATIGSSKAKLGIFSPKPVPYSRACREGWAPAPTNAVQKALYERFNSPTARFQQDFMEPQRSTSGK